MVHPGGRPRTVSFSEEEMIDLGKEMVEWVKQNDPLHLSEWYTIEKMFIYEEWKTFIQRKEFIPYYQRALKIVGKNYLHNNGKVNPGISQRWQRVYFKDLKEQEDQDLDDAAKRASKENLETSDTDKELLMAMLDLIKDKQRKRE